MTRNEIIEIESKILGLNEEQKLKVSSKADYIISNPNSNWYKSTQKKAIEKDRGLYAQAIYEANWVLYVKPLLDKDNVQNIKFNKKIYESIEAEASLDRDFNEFKIKKYTTIEFFEHYNTLFYDIPQTGVKPNGSVLYTETNENGDLVPYIAEGPKGEKPTEGFYVINNNNNIWVSTKNTHKELIEKSKEYVGTPIDPIDEEIQQLIKQLEGINNEIENIPKTHPFFNEGDIIELDEPPHHKYYIQGGLTRPIWSSEVFNSLKSVAGFSKSDPSTSITIRVDIEGIESIGVSPLGPIYSMKDL